MIFILVPITIVVVGFGIAGKGTDIEDKEEEDGNAEEGGNASGNTGNERG